MKKHIEDVWQRGNTVIPSRLLGGYRSMGASTHSTVNYQLVEVMDDGSKKKPRQPYAKAMDDIVTSRATIAGALRAIASAGVEVRFQNPVKLQARSEYDLIPHIGSHMLFGMYANQIAASINIIRQARADLKKVIVKGKFMSDTEREVRSAWNLSRIGSDRGRTTTPASFFGGNPKVIPLGNNSFIDFVEQGRTIKEQIAGKQSGGANDPAIPWLFLPMDWAYRLKKLNGSTPISPINMGHRSKIMPIAWRKVITMGGIEVWKVAIVARMALSNGEWNISELADNAARSAMAIAYLASSTHLPARQMAISLDMDRAVSLARRRTVAYARKGF